MTLRGHVGVLDDAADERLAIHRGVQTRLDQPKWLGVGHGVLVSIRGVGGWFVCVIDAPKQ